MVTTSTSALWLETYGPDHQALVITPPSGTLHIHGCERISGWIRSGHFLPATVAQGLVFGSCEGVIYKHLWSNALIKKIFFFQITNTIPLNDAHLKNALLFSCIYILETKIYWYHTGCCRKTAGPLWTLSCYRETVLCADFTHQSSKQRHQVSFKGGRCEVQKNQPIFHFLTWWRDTQNQSLWKLDF